MLCSDGIYEINAKLLSLNANIEVIKKVEELCVERAKIRSNDEALRRFNRIFRQKNKDCVVDLFEVGFELEIKSLIDLLMKDVDDMFLNMSANQAYKILFVNLKSRRFSSNYQLIKDDLRRCRWPFEAAIDDDSKKLTHYKIPRKGNMHDKQIAMTDAEPVLAEENIDPGLLELPFDQYKTLPDKKRQQWLAAHFIIRRP
ncbi:uncharacterized protein [Rutidosis leptorrhynchoides]|uniref:uncharacterized protein n=1 Tax=Rutidosis leptorrhynchoides TaxID=125765 RepID=UPI003A99018E